MKNDAFLAALTERDGGVYLDLHVQPRASRTEFAGMHGGRVKLRVQSPPVEGAANDEIVRFLASRLACSKRDIQLVSGSRGRRKRAFVRGVSSEAVVDAFFG